MCFLESQGQEKKEQVQGVPLLSGLMKVVGGVDDREWSGRERKHVGGSWLGNGWPHGVLTVVRLQSVGMCGCVAGVAGAALEAVVVFLLAVADTVHAVRLYRSELHALNVHLCTKRENTPGYFQYCLKKHPTVGIFIREPAARVD